MNTVRFLIVFWCVWAGAFAAEPAQKDAYAQLDTFLKGLRSLQADFHQTVKDAQGREVEESNGKLAILRPNRFRWDYREPNVQVIVADGTRLWLYDPDLEQVTVRRLDQSFAGTPAMLLSGEGDLRSSFKVQSGEKRNGVDWITLTPSKDDTDFKQVRLGLRKNVIAGMELADKLGQVTVLEFSNVKLNPSFDKERFAFTPPSGVDVIGGEATR